MERYIGKKLDGRYEIKEVLGVGGMAVVFKAFDSVEQRMVAVKVLKQEYLTNEEFKRRFKNESKAIAMMSHPNIVKVYDVGMSDTLQYIVMEFIDGITLKDYIEQEGTISWKSTVHFISQILRAIQHAHDRGIVHRDIKPQNIMLLKDGTIKVTDFGIARFSRSGSRTITDKAIGSVHYISPEQARGGFVDEKTDIYSIGVMMYEMLTGRLPFDAESPVSVAIMQMQADPQSPRELNDTIPEGLEQITQKAMQKDPGLRYQSAAEMIRDIERFKKNPSVQFEYKYFGEEPATKYVDAVNQVKNTSEYNDYDRRHSPMIPIISAIACAFVLIVLVLVLWLFKDKLNLNLGGTSSVTEQTITVPELRGKLLEVAQSNEEYGSLIVVEEEEYNSDYAAGEICYQSPTAGVSIDSNRKITVHVSLGQQTEKVLDVAGYAAEDARTALRQKGFTDVKIMTEESDTVAKGTVIRTSPEAYTQCPLDGEVILYVSGGRGMTIMDNLIGLTIEEAQERLEENNLVLDTANIEYVSSDYEEGIVVGQSAEANTEVEIGSTITIRVSNGTREMRSYALYIDLSTFADCGNVTVDCYVDGTKTTSVNKLVDSTSTGVFIANATGNTEETKVTFLVHGKKKGILGISESVEARQDWVIDFTQDPAAIVSISEWVDQ